MEVCRLNMSFVLNCANSVYDPGFIYWGILKTSNQVFVYFCNSSPSNASLFVCVCMCE